MSEVLPRITIVIPTKPGLSDVLSAESVQSADYPRDQLEVIIARGNQPSAQRNTAVREASGGIIYFLDDDSVAMPGNLRRIAAHFRDPAVVMVGGPNLCPPDAPPLEQAFAQVLGSWLAFGPSRARYSRIGTLRPSGEKELILCNLAARKEAFLAAGGFDEALYPNEENALMDTLQSSGGTLLYDPDLVVYRRPRRTLGAFARMLMTYGRGRAEQVRLHPSLGSAPNFVPPLFCVYLLVLPFLPIWGLAPLAAYFLVLVAQAVQIGITTHRFPDRAIPLISLAHVMYGLGFWRGLFTPLRKPDGSRKVTVHLDRIPLP